MAHEPNIRESVRNFHAMATSGSSREEIATELVKLLTKCLDAHGAALWACWRDDAGSQHLVAEAWDGQIGVSDSFAKSVVQAMEFLCRNDDTALLLGVPITREGRCLGVIEVRQRPISGKATRRGHLRFMDQMAEIVGFSPTF